MQLYSGDVFLTRCETRPSDFYSDVSAQIYYNISFLIASVDSIINVNMILYYELLNIIKLILTELIIRLFIVCLLIL